MEGFQAKENTFVERKAKELSPFQIRYEIREADRLTLQRQLRHGVKRICQIL